MYHQAVYDMRHKILMALQELPEIRNVCLSDISELEETFVLDCYKVKKLADETARKPRKHGTKLASKEIKVVFENHISAGILILCDGLRSYNELLPLAECTVKDFNSSTKEEKCFDNLNNVNGFHSYIKQQQIFYREVTFQYLN